MAKQQLSFADLKKTMFKLAVIQVISDYARIFYVSDIQKAYHILLTSICVAAIFVISDAVAFYKTNISAEYRNTILGLFINTLVIWSIGMLFIWANLYGT